MGTGTTHWTVLGTENWKIAGARDADRPLLWHGTIPWTPQGDCPPPSSTVGLPSPSPFPHPTIYLIPWRIGSMAQGPSGRESWTCYICWSLGRAAPAHTGLYQKYLQILTEAELVSNFKAIWRALIVQTHCFCCDSLPNP